MLKIHTSIDQFSADKWDAMVQHRYPFLQHAFLRALETHNSIGEQSGWQACYLAYYEDNTLMGAMPLYVKYNSWGEFVFDHAWAQAFEQLGMAYYPKLVNAIAFTPACGQRLLLSNNAHSTSTISDTLIQGALSVMADNELSGLHCLFANDDDFARLQRPDALIRYDCQYHFNNQHYSDFDAFLNQLKAKKRKNIRQERRKAHTHGLEIMRLDGHSATQTHWQQFAHLFARIYERKYGRAAFSADFFIDIAKHMPDQIHLVCANDQGRMLAAALMYSDEHTLYGRHWGCIDEIDCLHFELCYYQGIELCIEKGLSVFDPGAQGEHKIARGFVPTLTRSLHYMQQTQLSHAIAVFCQRERKQVLAYIQQANTHVPYSDPDKFCHDYSAMNE